MVQGVARHLDLQGHRGARGLMPENTLPGFAAALSIGVTTIELDAAVTADGVVVASHDRRLNPDLTRRGNGLWLSRPGPDIHSLTLGALRGYDVGRIKPGSAYADEFPAQAGWDGIAIPTLDEVIGLTEAAGNARVRFNVEIKSSPLEPAATLPPERYASAVLETLDRLGVGERGRCSPSIGAPPNGRSRRLPMFGSPASAWSSPGSIRSSALAPPARRGRRDSR